MTAASPTTVADEQQKLVNFDQLILAFGALLLMARVLGWIFHRLGQPRVIGK